MKIGGATILSGVAICSLVSASPAKRDKLKCHAVSGAGWGRIAGGTKTHGQGGEAIHCV